MGPTVYDADMKIAVIIPAAGKSTRYGEKDKLAEDLGGRPLLIRTVEFFTKREKLPKLSLLVPLKVLIVLKSGLDLLFLFMVFLS